jgi:uncharacterized Zn finger protein
VREDAQTKAARLAGSGRVTVRHVSDIAITADVRGDSAAVYPVTWSPAGWACPCPASTRCSHIRAVQLVVLEPLPVGGPGPDGVIVG